MFMWSSPGNQLIFQLRPGLGGWSESPLVLFTSTSSGGGSGGGHMLGTGKGGGAGERTGIGFGDDDSVVLILGREMFYVL